MVFAATEAEGSFIFTGKHIENLDFDGVFRRRPLWDFDVRWPLNVAEVMTKAGRVRWSLWQRRPMEASFSVALSISMAEAMAATTAALGASTVCFEVFAGEYHRL